MHTPLIGISTYLENDVRWGVWQHRAAVLPAGYPRLVQRAGGCAVMLPPDVPERAEAVVSRLDGLVVSGGPDVEPVRYGAAPEPECGPPDRERDDWELALIEAALARHLPLLGICRGMQLLNVALGGTLVQHLEGHRGGPGVFAQHSVRPVAGTRLARALPEPVSVPTYHHQSLSRLGDGLVPGAYAEDGTVEAVELPGSEHPFVLAVQWHPEEGEDTRVMRALVEAASGPSPVGELAEPAGSGSRV
ncbi:gamma-glutamyl-gamma-aminobutyrate hydrolase family protein [Streptomyces ovatisporus]|uniref:Gamma-glutamyl-gamma-aminobutyrate hydrolase family protein n=1 Tax=Streptomyces ovatisporus TaxID=1128682 RepID=A0ABV9AD92_9ACTN